MITTISIFLLILWFFGAFGVYHIGWFYHIFLVTSIMLMFIVAMRHRKPEIHEIMINNDLSEAEAKRVKKIMDKNKLSEREAIELLSVRSRLHLGDGDDLLQTETGQVKKIMSQNKLNEREAVGLLRVRLKLRHHH